MAWAEWGKNRKSNMNCIEDWLASSPNFCLSKIMGHPLNSFHESPCSPIKIAIGMRYAVCITIFGHLHFEISWSNTRPPFFRQVCTPHVRSQRLSCGREIPSKKGLKTLPLCWIYSFLGYSRRGWGLLRTTTLHRTWKRDIANRNHCDIVQMDVHQCTRW